LLPAVGLTLVAFSDNVLTARAFGARTRTTISPNQELLALGVSNAASGLVAGFPVSSSGSRTAVIAAAGGKTQVCSIVAAIMVAGVALVGRSALASFPTAACAAGSRSFAAQTSIWREGRPDRQLPFRSSFQRM
jgi:MFS superfamily sulfate permease-like transporter